MTQEMGNILKISKSNNENHLYKHDYVNYFYVYLPYKLEKKKNFIFQYNKLFNEIILFLEQIVMTEWIHRMIKLTST